ncbi:MAG: hypothetical protein V3T17_12905 [Pseudomonadales bacterium]
MAIKFTKGILVEYTLSIPPLILQFEFNPENISYSRSVNIPKPDPYVSRLGFCSPQEASRVSQGAIAQKEKMTVKVLLDATDRMNNDDFFARTLGVQPEIDTARLMVEPKVQGPGGVQVLASLAALAPRAIDKKRNVSVYLFLWGLNVWPVFVTNVNVEETHHFSNLVPYRAKLDLSLEVIENNAFYQAGDVRRILSSVINLTNVDVLSVLASLATATTGGLL